MKAALAALGEDLRIIREFIIYGTRFEGCTPEEVENLVADAAVPQSQ